MPLADFTPERKTIMWKDKALVSVRGLTFTDISALARAHIDAANSIYNDITKTDGAVPLSVDYGSIALKIITSDPDLAARVIVRASDEEGEESIVSVIRMPLSLQILILLEILTLTFEDVGGPLGLLALVMKSLGVPQTLVSRIMGEPTTEALFSTSTDVAGTA